MHLLIQFAAELTVFAQQEEQAWEDAPAGLKLLVQPFSQMYENATPAPFDTR